jgi:uncharacterized membrane protein
MVFIISIFTMIPALLFQYVIFTLGRVLENSEQFRQYFGLEDEKGSLSNISVNIELIGKLLKVIAIVGAIATVAAALKLLFN